MIKKISILIALSLLAVSCHKASLIKPGQVACTMEAKLCPDGSSVGRTGPNCEFAACPQPPSPAHNPSPAPTPSPIACPQIARACPDGSFVHPQGPNCEIPACPAAQSQTSGIQGSINLGPTCPVQRVPPDPNCNDKPYQATIIVKTADGKKQITSFTSAADGSFKVNLNPGSYLLVPQNAQVYPRAGSQTVTVTAKQYTQVNIAYDTGIR